MPPDSPDVPDAGFQAIEKSADYVCIGRRNERIPLPTLNLVKLTGGARLG
jgi:hypothetical protein